MDIDSVARLAIEKEKAYIKKDCEYFIAEYAYIEDKDSDTGKAKFRLWDEQKRLLAEIADNRLNIILKARQLGITWLSLWFALWNMIFTVGFTVVALSRRDDEAKELIRRMEFMLENLPSWLIIRKQDAPKDYEGIMWDSITHEVMIIRADSEDSRIVAMPSAKDSGRSFTASLVILDEWAFQQWAEEIWTASYPTINRPTGGKVIGLSTAKKNTLFENIWYHAHDYNFHRIFLSWRADPRRTDEWYEQTKKALCVNKKYLQEYPSTPEEAFSAGDLTSFPEFSEDIHVCEPFEIPKYWRKFGSVDNGYSDPFAWYKYAVSPDGIVYVYYEYSRERESQRIYYSDQSKHFNESMKYSEIEYGQVIEKMEKLDYIVAGLDAWNTHHRDQSGKSLIDYYKDGGIEKVGFMKAVTDRKLRKATVHEYLKPYYDEVAGKFTAKVQIFSTCKYLIDTLPRLVNDEKDMEKVEDSDIDNQYDSFGYGLITYHIEKSKVPHEYKGVIDRHKSELAKKIKKKRRVSL